MFFEALYFGHFLSFYTMQLEPPKSTAARASFMDWPPSVRKRCMTEDRKIMNVIDHYCYYHHYYYYYDHRSSTERDTKASVLLSQI